MSPEVPPSVKHENAAMKVWIQFSLVGTPFTLSVRSGSKDPALSVDIGGMGTACPICKSARVRRRRRRSVIDRVRSAVGQWPYVCRACGERFYLGQRRPSQPADRENKDLRASDVGSEGPQLAYRPDPVRPHAKILVQAETQEQLDFVLLALSQAVSAHQHASHGVCR